MTISDFDGSAFRNLYCDLMEEIKKRHLSIVAAINGFLPPQPKIIISEFCCLQLRLTCELIALGCLAAHGDIQETRNKRLRKAWKPDVIMSGLSALHSDFYPEPGEQVHDASGKVVQVKSIKDGFLTKENLLSLYGECGNALHRGNLQTLLSSDARVIDQNRIIMWCDKIRRLLNHHQIKLIDPKYQFWVIMQANTDGKVHGWLFERVTKETVE